MMKNLGKIILFLFLPISIFSNVTAELDSSTITKGEIATLKLKISGEDVKEPNIQSVCGYEVISSSSHTNMYMVNGELSKSYTLSYQFMPLQSCEIEPIKINIDEKEYTTKSLNIEVKEQVTDKKSNFILSLVTQKNNVFVGQTFDVDLFFKQRDGAEALDSKFVQPKFKGFWVKKQTNPQSYKENGFNITKITYTLAAQRDGKLSIAPAQISIASRKLTKDGWGSWIQNIKWKTFFSNTLSIDVKPLPKDVKYIGDFVIYADVDKTTVETNQALNLTLKVMGDGNIEDMSSFKPSIDGVNVFDEKIVIKGNVLTQKMAFVSDKDFVIEPFELKYFDTKTQKVKSIKTKEIRVSVNGAKQIKELTIKRDEIRETHNSSASATNDGSISISLAIVVFLVGLLSGVIVMFTKPWKMIEQRKKEKSLLGFNSVKNEKRLLIKLLPFRELDADVQKIVDVLERNIYSDAKEKIDMKVLKECLKRYDLV